MSSSWGNTINLFDSADEMFGKTMSIPDELIMKYFTLVTRVPLEEIEEIKKMPSPRDQKARLAFEIVKMYHGETAAQEAEEEFNKTFRDDNPTFVEYITKEDFYPKMVNDIVVNVSGATSSVSAAQKLITQGAVEIDGQVDKDWNKVIRLKEEG